MSSLSWIDFDEVERQRARRIMALFEEKDSRDELGLGSIRDSIADHLFPGTSTIQTRLRYMLFVPWIYGMVESLSGSAKELSDAARAREIRLIAALLAGNERDGVIGRDAGASLQRLPSSIYWAGLRSWGIRVFPGSQETFFATLPALRRRRARSDADAEAAAETNEDLALWRPGLPPPPNDLLERASFQLSREEAGFLVDRLVDSQPKSLLTRLAKARQAVECEFIWQHPALSTFPEAMRLLVRQAEIFSMLMHGASLLYNLMLAERLDHKERMATYRESLDEWSDTLARTDIAAWETSRFWSLIVHEDHRIAEPARHFVERWRELIVRGDAADCDAARDLVESRESRLKGAQSRFRNRSALDRWGGSSGASRLSFRWRQASNHLRDLADAQ